MEAPERVVAAMLGLGIVVLLAGGLFAGPAAANEDKVQKVRYDIDTAVLERQFREFGNVTLKAPDHHITIEGPETVIIPKEEQYWVEKPVNGTADARIGGPLRAVFILDGTVAGFAVSSAEIFVGTHGVYGEAELVTDDLERRTYKFDVVEPEKGVLKQVVEVETDVASVSPPTVTTANLSTVAACTTNMASWNTVDVERGMQNRDGNCSKNEIRDKLFKSQV